MNTIPPPYHPPAQNPQPGQYPAQWVPAPQAPTAPAEPLPFHRLARTYSAYRWWKTIMVGLIALGLYLGLILLAGIVFVVVAIGNPELESTADEAMISIDSVDMSDPFVFAISMVSLILMLPVILLATRMMNVQKVGTLTSVAGRMRWGWLGQCLAVALGVLALSFGITFAIDALAGHGFAPDFGAPDMWLLLGMTILLVPFQATAEEYVFRGYLMQLVGGWLRHPAFAILLPIPLFMAGHMYDIYGQLDVGFFALAAGWLAWRTGGLEAAIALHVVNNSVIFALGAIGLVDVSATESDLPSLLASMATTVVFVVVIVKLANKRKIQRLSVPPAPAPAIAAPGYWVQPGDSPRQP
ncbi:lysostaphin resistance A-like protein [Paeniglutamicibacter sp. MACA_103]|uniref:CPBP family intramembrane glutamic endopeptidase n=1 Tax=Paeniglutamicibacter sp. MACA_103 TaxID=3377337 RepID=UPI00389324C5